MEETDLNVSTKIKLLYSTRIMECGKFICFNTFTKPSENLVWRKFYDGSVKLGAIFILTYPNIIYIHNT